MNIMISNYIIQCCIIIQSKQNKILTISRDDFWHACVVLTKGDNCEA